jgi:hypothetical protein
MSTDTTHLIVGASLAGAKAAETLREEVTPASVSSSHSGSGADRCWPA